jgi:hypothetical protein
MNVIISYHDDTYKPLADYTWFGNKIPYAEKHGYQCETEKMIAGGHASQMQKVAFINRMLHDPRNFEWIWWTGCDLMVTNFNIRMEDRTDNNYHMIIATDCNGFNADSILVRNTQQSKDYWKMVSEILPGLHWHWEGEQKIIKDTYPNYKDIIKVVPQRDINSYNYDTYNGAYTPVDFLNTNGNWQPGDWAIQWPGLSLETRLQLAAHYTQQVIK